MTQTYPPLRFAVLNGLLSIKDRAKDPDFLEDAPYDVETKDILRKILGPTIVERIVEKEVPTEGKNSVGRPSKDIRLSEDDQTLLSEEVVAMIKDLGSMGTGDTTLDIGSRIQIAKTKTNLLAELLKMRERNTHAKKMEEFMETVIGILNDFISEGDRATFLRRIEPYR